MVKPYKILCLLFLIIALFFSFAGIAQNKIAKSSIGFSIDIPLLNGSHYYDYVNEKEDTKHSHFGIGFYGYYKRGKNKFSLGYEAPMLDKFFPPSGGYTSLTAHILEALLHHQFISFRDGEKLNGIIGLNKTEFTYTIYSDAQGYSGFTKHDQTFGLSAGIEFEPFKFFSISFLYRFGFIDFDRPIYQDVYSLSAKFSINVWNRKIIATKEN